MDAAFRISENSVKRKFVEFPFKALRWIRARERAKEMIPDPFALRTLRFCSSAGWNWVHSPRLWAMGYDPP